MHRIRHAVWALDVARFLGVAIYKPNPGALSAWPFFVFAHP